MEIRRATVEDLAGLEPIARRFYASSERLRSFDAGRFTALWTGMIQNGMGVIFLYCDPEPAGAIGGVKYPEAYSSDTLAQEFFWFVDEDHRGGGLGLYHAFEQWARDEGCDEIRMGHLVDLMPAKLTAVYRRLGFEQIETNWAKRLTREAEAVA